jgi:hypothetical protein
MGSLSLTGMIAAGPIGSACDTFPTATTQIPLGFIDGARPYDAATGILIQTIASSSAFVPLVGVGPTGPVTQAAALYFKCDGPCTLRLTFDDGSGSQEVVEIPVHGIFLQEFPTTQPLEYLEIMGDARIEYFACGPS